MFALIGTEEEIKKVFLAVLLFSVFISMLYFVPGGEGGEELSFQMLAAVLLFTGAVIFMIYFFPKVARYFFAFVEFFFTFTMGFFFFSLFLNPLTALSGALALLAARALFRHRYVKNLCTALVASTASGVLGAYLSFKTALIFATMLAVYDFIAVFVTKHMVVIAKFLGGGGGGPMRMLGTGDIVVPALVAATISHGGLLFALFSIAGAFFGLLYTFDLLEKYKRPLPALPPILFFQLLFTLPLLLLIQALRLF